MLSVTATELRLVGEISVGADEDVKDEGEANRSDLASEESDSLKRDMEE